MTLLARYLVKDMIKPTLVALIVMLTLIWLLQSLRFLDFMINRGLDIGTFLWVTALILPSLLIIIVPLAFFTGSCYSFKRLNDDSELSILFSAGLSRLKIIKPLIVSALLLVGVGYALTLWLMPAGMSTFKQLQHSLREQGGTFLLSEGTFTQVNDNLTVYLKKRPDSLSLENILVHDTSHPERPVTWIAKSGQVVPMNDGTSRLLLKKGIRQEVSDKRTTMLEFDEHTIDLTTSFSPPKARWREAEERYLGELNQLEGLSNQQVNHFYAEWHKRLLWPLLPFPLLFIAAASLVQPKHKRHGVTGVTLRAFVYGFLYLILMMVLHNLATEGQKLALYGQWALPLIVCTLALYKLAGNK